MKQLLLPPGRRFFQTRRFWGVVIGVVIVIFTLIIISQRNEIIELSRTVKILDGNFNAIDQRTANVESGVEELFEKLDNF